MSRSDLLPAYTCGSYHRRGRAGCASHHICADKLDELLKIYVRKVMDHSVDMLRRLDEDLASEQEDVAETEQSADELEEELQKKIEGLRHQIEMLSDKRNTIIQVNRVARTAIEVFRNVLEKEPLERNDLELIIQQILVYEDHLEIKLQSDIDAILRAGGQENAVNFRSGIVDISKTRLVQGANRRPDKVYDVNVINDGDPSQITLAWWETFCFAMGGLGKRQGWD